MNLPPIIDVATDVVKSSKHFSGLWYMSGGRSVGGRHWLLFQHTLRVWQARYRRLPHSLNDMAWLTHETWTQKRRNCTTMRYAQRPCLNRWPCLHCVRVSRSCEVIDMDEDPRRYPTRPKPLTAMGNLGSSVLKHHLMLSSYTSACPPLLFPAPPQPSPQTCRDQRACPISPH